MADVKLRDPDNDSLYLGDSVEFIMGDGADPNDASAGDFKMYWDGTNARLNIDAASGPLFWANGTTVQAIKIGSLSSTTAGTGLELSDSVTRAVEINTDDNNTTFATATMARSLACRHMIYANQSNENFAVDGLTKWSSVAHTGNVHAGVLGRFETTGTCTTATGSGNTFVAGVCGRLGFGSGVTLGAGTYACGVLSFYNTSAANDPTGEYTVAYMATASDIAGTGDWDYGLYIEDTRKAAYFNVDLAAITSEEHHWSLAGTGTLSSGDSMVGVNIVTTCAGSAGSWVSALYAKTVQASKMVNGYLCAVEFELASTAANVSDHAVMVLNWSCNHTGSPAASDPYILLRDYGTTHANTFVRVFNDTGQSGTTDATTLVTTVADNYEQNTDYAIRCMLGSTPIWLCASSTAPS